MSDKAIDRMSTYIGLSLAFAILEVTGLSGPRSAVHWLLFGVVSIVLTYVLDRWRWYE